LVAGLKADLEALGEYVVMANVESGWFAMFPGTWKTRVETARMNGRQGANLVFYRTKFGNPRDHYVIPYSVVRELLSENTLAVSSVDGSQRWNLTLKNEQLRVTHRPGKMKVSEYYSVPLLLESSPSAMAVLPIEAIDESVSPSIIEGIAREAKVVTRSRSRKLRRSAMDRSKGVCEACGTDFSKLFDGKGVGVLQVHHREQLALQELPRLTSSEELAVVCANCHAMIHSDPLRAMPVEALRALWELEKGVPHNPRPQPDVTAGAVPHG
jgi:hypothetical protein